MSQQSIISALMAVINERRDHPPEEPSYVVSLLQKGTPQIGAKIVEEAIEVVQAAEESGANGRDHVVQEVADLFFHMLILLGHRRIGWAEIEAELHRRFGVSGLVEKEAREQSAGS